MTDIYDLCQIIHRGIRLNFEDLAEEIIAAGFHRDRTITTAEELDALPNGSVVVDDEMAALQKDNGRWEELSGIGYSSEDILDIDPVTVLYEGARDE
ncbi:hypothetical protein DUY81_13905 [Acidipropionibacterium acidipropionici]|uniref:Uncharacterized protein n=1 Tax=Acidipropionibacterium acidipropionici TaxID=1748 RepID=A0AAC9FCH1_9ACTN|nr:hypothetical protein [Acidipropionibacterium acidipropionici]AMS06476.1 hypothetical protein AXH35_14460 [Acidipropionibacterium acidipropionici]AOZ47923.1 hypothetical protein A8L58_15915 [Acidipropionibacterium acidipropionici]AZP38731.1 hypothetical protein DUY81_13905 [Acidipropionibacterium acidipropionici]